MSLSHTAKRNPTSKFLRTKKKACHVFALICKKYNMYLKFVLLLGKVIKNHKSQRILNEAMPRAVAVKTMLKY